MKRLLVLITLLLTPTLLFASASGMSALATLTSSINIISAISIRQQTDLRFPTLVSGMSVDNINTDMPSQVSGGLPGQNAIFRVNGQSGYCFSVTAGDQNSQATIMNTLNLQTFTYNLIVPSNTLLPVSGAVDVTIKGNMASLNTGATDSTGVYLGTAVVTVTYTSCQQQQEAGGGEESGGGEAIPQDPSP